MNVPKTPDYKLIGALRILASDANTEEGLLEAVLHETADRLAELTQPQPIETAPRDGTDIWLYIGKPFLVSGCWLNDDAEGQQGGWSYSCEEEEEVFDIEYQPTHWLPCVKVDPASLGGQADG